MLLSTIEFIRGTRKVGSVISSWLIVGKTWIFKGESYSCLISEFISSWEWMQCDTRSTVFFYHPTLLPTYVSTRDNELSTFCTHDSKAHQAKRRTRGCNACNLIHVVFIAAWSIKKVQSMHLYLERLCILNFDVCMF